MMKPKQYDVFLSHNRINKPWVGGFGECLRSAGLEVFFDVESIEPGANFVAAIGNALDTSRHVVLALSDAALKSRWVAMETVAAVLADPDAAEGRVVPVLLDPIAPERLPVTLRFRQTVNLYDARIRDAQLQKLLHHLGVPDDPGRSLPPWPVETLEVVDVAGVTAWGWDAERFVRELMRIDAEVYGDALKLDDETARAWAPLFFDHPESWRVLAEAPEQIVAYWHCLPLLPGEFDELISGRLTYDRIAAAQIAVLGVRDRYDLYCAGICLRQRYRRPVVFKLLFESLLNVIESLAAEGILFERIGANAFSAQGESLCRSLGMGRRLDHPRSGVLYSQDMPQLLLGPLAQRRARLIEAYR